MSDLSNMMKAAGLPWCEPDDCPPSICGGPHQDVVTHLGTERIRFDQEPIGRPVPGPTYSLGLRGPDGIEVITRNIPAHLAATLVLTDGQVLILEDAAILRSDTTKGE